MIGTRETDRNDIRSDASPAGAREPDARETWRERLSPLGKLLLVLVTQALVFAFAYDLGRQLATSNAVELLEQRRRSALHPTLEERGQEPAADASEGSAAVCDE